MRVGEHIEIRLYQGEFRCVGGKVDCESVVVAQEVKVVLDVIAERGAVAKDI